MEIKKSAAALALAVSCLTFSASARAQQAGSLGGGVRLGDPTGLELKYWVGDAAAFDAGVGFSGDAVFYADYLWHSWTILPQPQQGKLGTYVGFGPRIQAEREDSTLGVRTVAGVDYWLAGHPIEFFLDLGPVFQIAHEHGVGFDAGIGVHFYFAGR